MTVCDVCKSQEQINVYFIDIKDEDNTVLYSTEIGLCNRCRKSFDKDTVVHGIVIRNKEIHSEAVSGKTETIRIS